ncbi:MAG: TlpA disulfide reductase family protein [Actinomycetota bacterium]|nr:TlpA disulfide reductase family protein [Actinomycetota bacterium]
MKAIESAPAPADAEAAGIEAARRRYRRRMRWSIGALVVLIAAGVLFAATGGSAPTNTAAPLPAPPTFRLSELGQTRTLAYPSAAYRHRPVVLVFFASWCGPCQKEMPVLSKVVRGLEAAHTPVAFIGIDGNDPTASGLAFARKVKLPFVAVSDQQEAVADQLGLPGLPDTVFLSAKGKVVHVVEGPISPPTLRRWVARLSREGA